MGDQSDGEETAPVVMSKAEVFPAATDWLSVPVATLAPDELRRVRSTVTLFAAVPSFFTLVMACTVGLAADPVVVTRCPRTGT